MEEKIIEELRVGIGEPLRELNGSYYTPLRITGTGDIDRNGVVTNRPVDLIPLENYAGLPVVLLVDELGEAEHPKRLDSDNFKEVTVGTIMSPFIKKGKTDREEIWGIARIFEEVAIAYLEGGYSTSPLFRSKVVDGVEIESQQVDHLAIVNTGAWDIPCGSVGNLIFNNKKEKKVMAAETDNKGVLEGKENEIAKVEEQIKEEEKKEIEDSVPMSRITEIVEKMIKERIDSELSKTDKEPIKEEIIKTEEKNEPEEEYLNIEDEDKYEEIMDSAKTIAQLEKNVKIPLYRKGENITVFADRVCRSVIKGASPEDSVLLNVPVGKIPLKDSVNKINSIKDRFLNESKKLLSSTENSTSFVFADKFVGGKHIKECINDIQVNNAFYEKTREEYDKKVQMKYENFNRHGGR